MLNNMAVESDRNGEAGEYEIGGEVERKTDELEIAERAKHQKLQGEKRIFTDQRDDDAGKSQRRRSDSPPEPKHG